MFFLYFLIIDDNTIIKAVLIKPSSQFKCEIQPKFSDSSLNISLWLNESIPNELGGLLSIYDSKILFSKIRFDPRLIEHNSLLEIKLVSEGSSFLYVPPQYHSNSFKILSVDSLIQFPCSVDSMNVKCQKSVINSNGLFDIYFKSFKILSNNVELTPINDQIMIYSKILSSFKFRK
jgi:hypothetical protein